MGDGGVCVCVWREGGCQPCMQGAWASLQVCIFGGCSCAWHMRFRALRKCRGFFSRRTIQPRHNRKETLMQQTHLLLGECTVMMCQSLTKKIIPAGPLTLPFFHSVFSFVCIWYEVCFYTSYKNPLFLCRILEGGDIDSVHLCVHNIFDLCEICKNTDRK